MLAERIEVRLNGNLSAAALAAWAFDRFYDVEMGVARLEDGMEEHITEVLDALMFADDTAFRLDDEELRRMVALLRTT